MKTNVLFSKKTKWAQNSRLCCSEADASFLTILHRLRLLSHAFLAVCSSNFQRRDYRCSSYRLRSSGTAGWSLCELLVGESDSLTAWIPDAFSCSTSSRSFCLGRSTCSSQTSQHRCPSLSRTPALKRRSSWVSSMRCASPLTLPPGNTTSAKVQCQRLCWMSLQIFCWKS